MDRNWTLNDKINHHKHGFIPINQSPIQMNLSYRKSPEGNKVFVASFLLDLNDLLRRDLVRLDDKGHKTGFRLRFVHNLADHGIYIQRNQRCPHLFVAVVPPQVLRRAPKPRKSRS